MIKIRYSNFYGKYVVTREISGITDARFNYTTTPDDTLESILDSLHALGFEDSDISVESRA